MGEGGQKLDSPAKTPEVRASDTDVKADQLV